MLAFRGNYKWLRKNLTEVKLTLILVLSVTLTTVKTTLTAAITTVLAKKVWLKLKLMTKSMVLQKKKERGITINTAHVEYQTEKTSLCTR